MAQNKASATGCAAIPDGDHWAIVRDSACGGLTYEAFTDLAAWQAAVETAYKLDVPFKALMVQTAKATVAVKLDRPPVDKPTV